MQRREKKRQEILSRCASQFAYTPTMLGERREKRFAFTPSKATALDNDSWRAALGLRGRRLSPTEQPRPRADSARRETLKNGDMVRWLRVHRKRIPEDITPAQRAHYRRIFDMIDLDDSQELDIYELSEALRDVGISMNASELIDLLHHMDPAMGAKDTLDFDEFCHTLSNGDEWEALLPIRNRQRNRFRKEHPSAASTRRTSLRGSRKQSRSGRELMRPTARKVKKRGPNPLMPFHLWVPTYHRRNTIKGILQNGLNDSSQKGVFKVMGVGRERWDKPSRRRDQFYHLRDSPSGRVAISRESSLETDSRGSSRRPSVTDAAAPDTAVVDRFERPKRTSARRRKREMKEKRLSPTAFRLRTLPESCYPESAEDSRGPQVGAIDGAQLIAPETLHKANHKFGQKKMYNANRKGLSSEWQFLVNKLSHM